MNKLSYPEVRNYEGNWVEDYSLENGNYINECIICKNGFLGHKNRRLCKVCMPKNIHIEDIENLDKTIESLVHSQTKEAMQLSEIIEQDRGITITAEHLKAKPLKLGKIKKFWKNGKLRYK